MAGLELSSVEKTEMLHRLNGPVYKIKSSGKSVAGPLLARLNEFVLACSDQSYVKYDIKVCLPPSSLLPTHHYFFYYKT